MSNIIQTPEQEENEQIRVSQEIEESILTNVTIDIHDSSRIEALIASIKVGEFKKVGGVYNLTAYKDNRIELISFGYKYGVIIKREFTNETNNDDKFDRDFRVAVEDNPRTTITYFIDSEIERLNDIKELIIKCFGTSKTYPKSEQYISMCNYLEFLNEYKENDSTKGVKHKYPTIDIKKYDSDRIYNAFFKGEIAVCTIDCFKAWFVDGYISEAISFVLKGRENKPAIAQLRRFIETITGDAENTKDAYYANVFKFENKKLKLNNTKTAKNLDIIHINRLKLCEK